MKSKLPHADPTGYFKFMHEVMFGLYGEHGQSGRGRWQSATRKGPGIRHGGKNHPAGTKLVKRFIRDGRGENTEYRKLHAALTREKYRKPA